jgi:hypothetical protein
MARSRSVRGDVALKARIKAIATARICYGERRIHVLFGREGWQANIIGVIARDFAA